MKFTINRKNGENVTIDCADQAEYMDTMKFFARKAYGTGNGVETSTEFPKKVKRTYHKKGIKSQRDGKRKTDYYWSEPEISAVVTDLKNGLTVGQILRNPFLKSRRAPHAIRIMVERIKNDACSGHVRKMVESINGTSM